MIATLATVGDTAVEWLRAGQALQRVLLIATMRGLAASFMTQPLEVPEIRELMNAGPLQPTAQMVLRFGYGEPAAASPRRSVVIVEPSELPVG